ncbi:MAG: tetratricopeptide repeat protein [Planctomycetota bacterium]|nr:tetratricopeptide repeat protein [Planctomycetota bacterium]
MSKRLVYCVACICLCVFSGTSLAQESKSDSKALAIFADAAGYQNNGAFELAIEEWQKLLERYPSDPLASKASHYLGVSYIQSQAYAKAVQAFQAALEDRKLDVREETLVNLGWCQFTLARSEQPESATQKRGFAQAKQTLEAFSKDYPRSDFLDQSFFYLGEIEYTLGNPGEAIGFYRRLLEDRKYRKSPLRADAQYALAVAYEEQKDARNALANFQAFLNEYPDHRLAGEVSVRQADLMLASGQTDEAVALLGKIAGQGELADYTLLRLGYAYSKQEKTAEAKQKYMDLLMRFPKSPHAPTAAISVGQFLYREGEYKEAEEQFRKAISGKDAIAEDAVHWLAVTLNQQNRFADAKQVVEEALTWAGGSVILKMDYADALYNSPDDMGKARAAYELIAKNHSQDPLAARAAYNAAFASLQMRDFEKAREWSQWFLQRFPQDTLRNDVAYVAAETLLQEGEYASAATAYDQLRRADPENESAALWTMRQAMAQYLGGKYQGAISLIRQSLNRFAEAKQKAEALFILGASLHYEEQYRDAITQFQASRKASERWESADEVLLLMAEAQQRVGEEEASSRSLQELLKSYPQSRLKPQAQYRLGQVSAAAGSYDAAVKQYEAILQNEAGKQYHSFAQYGIAWCLMQQDDYASALKQLENALPLLDDEALSKEAQLAKGICLRKLGRVDQAIDELQGFLDSSPKGVSLGNGLYEIGLAYTVKKKFKQANRYLTTLLKEVPNYPSAENVLYELAWNFQDAGDAGSAVQYFAKLAKDYPDGEFAGEASYMTGQRLYDQKKYAEAARVYSGVIDSTGDKQLHEKALYKLGWSYFQQEDYDRAQRYFAQQAKAYSGGSLSVDALFMSAECLFKQDKLKEALPGYRDAREKLESAGSKNEASAQVRELIYLHGGQCLREAKQWPECERWLTVVVQRFPKSSYLSTALYELAYCKQQQNQTDLAMELYENVADNYRTEVGARARFMMGEIYFSKRDYAKAIPEFQRVMFGFGGDRASGKIKNWQVKSAFEAARCSEILIDSLSGDARKKVIETAEEFYSFIVEKHSGHDLATRAKTRLGDLKKLKLR